MMAYLKGTTGSWIWLVTRLWLGYGWLKSGWGKLQDPKWMETGESLLAFWKRAAAVPQPPGRPLIAYDWYRSFIQSLIDGGHHVWFGKFVALGETLVGLALVLGLVTIFAAAMGALMNWSFIMAGTASTNGMMLVVTFFLIFVGGAYAGYIGLDYWVRPYLRKRLPFTSKADGTMA
jgi:thiosulfate dehydrogenase (quinone) large subunit